MKIIVTGSHGLIGSRLIRFLQDMKKHEIIGVDDMSCGYEHNDVEGVRYYMYTVGRDVMDSIVHDEQPDLIYHLAAFASEGLSPFVRKYNYSRNLLATAEVVNACINFNVRRLVFTSSMAVYGDGQTPFCETDRCCPVDPYGVAKYASEMDIRIAGEQHGLDWCILRPHNVYGAGQVVDQTYRNVLALWMRACLDGKPMIVYGDGLQQRAFSHVSDCLFPLWEAGTATEASREIINLGGGKPVTILDAAKTVLEVVGAGELEFAPPRHEVYEAYCTTDVSRDLLGFVDLTSLEDGVKELWEWVKNYQTSDSIGPPLEVTAGLYDTWS
jgi:UDP-glucose 4-epimerase